MEKIYLAHIASTAVLIFFIGVFLIINKIRRNEKNN